MWLGIYRERYIVEALQFGALAVLLHLSIAGICGSLSTKLPVGFVSMLGDKLWWLRRTNQEEGAAFIAAPSSFLLSKVFNL
ncbi:hypothetical protein BCS71_25765 [Vibrio lentus]|uniref:hypothetical protein n=1 Tax=Vibrio lentus TaxID=136468 RepID=UPI000C8429B8|nr:hypothetical protein [Vibrio lentus]PMI58279.1 hypothetical protein BCU41_03865 [Vibrio lentus]